MSDISHITVERQTRESELTLAGFSTFPANLFVIRVSPTCFACSNATLPTGDKFDGIACFPERDDAQIYLEQPARDAVQGMITQRSFDKIRELAIARSQLNGLVLFRRGRIVDYHFVR